jgi:fucose 4-O-acetylase-like acetyltransferase
MIKHRSVIVPMVAAWFLFIILDAFSSFFKTDNSNSRKQPFRCMSLVLKHFRSIVLFTIAILNFLLIVVKTGDHQKADG